MCPACCWGLSVYGCYHSDQHEGGRNGRKSGGIGFVWASFGGVSIKIHWRLGKVQIWPRPLLFTPLSTTFVHILRLNRLLSTRKFKVEAPFGHARREARSLVVNQKDDH